MRRKPNLDVHGRSAADDAADGGLNRRSLLLAGTAAAAAAALSPAALAQSLFADRGITTRFMRVPTQYIAALGDREATSGDNAQLWGLWRQDPGPRGVRLDELGRLEAAGGIAPAKWKFDSSDWWLEEHGLIMEQPEFPMPPGKYMVTGNREAKSVLTVQPMAADGTQHWELSDGATLYDVTHLRCRSARYTPAANGTSCSPSLARQSDFPVTPGAPMPPVANCRKQDYAVLIVLGVAVDNERSTHS
jgi:hypothetical protein